MCCGEGQEELVKGGGMYVGLCVKEYITAN